MLIQQIDTVKKKGSKYLPVASACGIKETIKKCTKLWDKIKYLIKTLHGDKSGEYGKDFMKNNFNFDLPFNKPLKFYAMTIIIRSVFEENGKYYPQAFLGECLYELWKCCNTNKLIFQKELILIKQVYQKNVCFVIIGILNVFVMNLNPMFATNVIMKLMAAYELKNITILNVKDVDYRCILWGVSKNDEINILNNSVSEEKGVL